MSRKTKAEPLKLDAGAAFRLWIGMLLPPVVCAVQLQVLWLTTEYGCKANDFSWNHVASIAAIIASVGGGLISYREWRVTGGGTDEDEATPESRRRFMAIIGLLTAGLFTITIFALWLPTLMGVPCDK